MNGGLTPEPKAGVQAVWKKKRAWSTGQADAPAGIVEFGPNVWRGNLPAEQNGLVMLGSPIGSKMLEDVGVVRAAVQEGPRVGCETRNHRRSTNALVFA